MHSTRQLCVSSALGAAWLTSFSTKEVAHGLDESESILNTLHQLLEISKGFQEQVLLAFLYLVFLKG